MKPEDLFDKVVAKPSEENLHDLINHYDKGYICRGYLISILSEVAKNGG